MNHSISTCLATLFILIYSSCFAQIEDENIVRTVQPAKNKVDTSTTNVVDLKLNFNENWLFKLGNHAGFEKENFNDKDWRIVSLPHDWSIEGKPEITNPSSIRGGYYPMGKGCYRKTFELDEKYKGKRVKIRFDGVYMNSKVYINGTFLGLRPYGFSTFEYDLSPFLNYGNNQNTIAVEIDNSLQENSRWYTGSGINRKVHLYISEQQHFQSFETFFRTIAIKDNLATLKVDFQIKSNSYPESQKVKFQAYPKDVKYVEKEAKITVDLKEERGNIIAQSENNFNLRDYDDKKISLDLTVKNPNLWSDSSPNLYNLELKLWIEGKLVNTEKHRVGIRKIEFNSQQGMLVNGEKVIVKGVCLHKDAGSFGTAVPKDVWRFRLEKLKKMGCNAFRIHGPVDPEFLEICDELGFFMMSEAFDEWEKNWQFGLSEDSSGKIAYGYHKYFKQWAETDLKDMVKRDRNHPSVFIYSIGNEVPEQRFDKGLETLLKLKNWVAEEDNTRPVTVGCDWAPWANANGFMDTMDIAGYNYPDRYYPKFYEEQHKDYPNRILLGTENYITQKNWTAVTKNPYVVGLFLWVGIDYLGESQKWPRRSWEWGLIDLASFEKSVYYNWQANWTKKPMVHTAVLLKNTTPYPWRPFDMRSHWNFKEKEVDTVFVFSNSKEVELFQNGKSLGRKKVNPDENKAIYTVTYKKGELVSKAYDGIKVIATHTLKTAQEPFKLGLTNQRPSADKDQLLFLTLEVQDKKGICVPYADNDITIKVEGGELIGLDSGDPFSHELFKQNHRKAYEGKLLITIRPDGKGKVKVTCFADDLKQGVMKLD